MESLILWLIKHPLDRGPITIQQKEMVNVSQGDDMISPALWQGDWEDCLAKVLAAVRFYNDSIRGQELFRGRP